MMKKHFLALFCILILCFSFIVPAFAQEIPAERQRPRLVDDADLLSSGEEKKLLAQLDQISTEQECDVVIVTVNSLKGKSPRNYADDFYDYNGYGFGENRDGVLLLLSMENRDWWMTTTGFGITALTDSIQKRISKQFLPKFGDEKYAQGFEIFANSCEKYISKARAASIETSEPESQVESQTESAVVSQPDNPVSENEISQPVVSEPALPATEEQEYPSIGWLPGSFLIGFVISFIILGVMKSGLKTVRHQNSAQNYVVPNSFHLTNSTDLFLYQQTNRRAKPKDNTSSRSGGGTHRSSSGTRHGGSGGKF